MIDDFVRALNNTQVQVIGPELVFGTLFDRIGYNAIKNEMFRNIVICRLFNPGSKLKTVDYLERYLHVTYSVDQIYRFLDNLCYRKEVEKGKKNKDEAAPAKPEAFKTRVEDIAYAHTKKMVGGEVSVCFYDMTTLYFEAAEEDDLRTCFPRWVTQVLRPHPGTTSLHNSNCLSSMPRYTFLLCLERGSV